MAITLDPMAVTDNGIWQVYAEIDGVPAVTFEQLVEVLERVFPEDGLVVNGPAYEPVEGEWLIELPDAASDQLIEDGFLSYDRDGYVLEAAMP